MSSCHFCRTPIDPATESYWEHRARALAAPELACANCASEMTVRQAIATHNGQREEFNARMDRLAKRMLREMR